MPTPSGHTAHKLRRATSKHSPPWKPQNPRRWSSLNSIPWVINISHF